MSVVKIPSIYAVVLAAGLGKRMNMKYPKQYLFIKNKTILEHSVSVLLSNQYIARVIIVVIPDDNYFNTLDIAKHPQVTFVYGGSERINSVLAGIKAANVARWIIIHDAARPCLHQDDLSRLLEIINCNGIGAILATPVRDTIKYAKLNDKIDYTLDRKCLWHALTPQIFLRDLLYKCLIKVISKNINITDEASALEKCGFYPKLIRGRSDNIKITYQEDLKLAEIILHLRISNNTKVQNENWTWF